MKRTKKKPKWVHAAIGEAPDPRNPLNLRVTTRVMIDDAGRAFEYQGITPEDAEPLRLPDPPDEP